MNNRQVQAAANQITRQLEKQFHPVHGFRYVLVIVNDPYSHSYNWFLNQWHPHHNARSQPIGVLPANLALLEAVVTLVHNRYQLTAQYQNFAQLRWPKTGQLIETRR
ncbi:hypothetical protein M3M39_04420 [Fructilactobacillus hinvesii]|uniref:Acetyl-CoA carboxylase n=1 Tax=Fructilactobacillus hinvesii TaxID=2940300 RepID=A0ABY5BS15_9LACO|nr:hypothetical protein [Fructilactobacillus hinvesii]USS87371.1 hypothetical protein M3M39_04420 [Fructilactobacillus hinvesii]